MVAYSRKKAEQTLCFFFLQSTFIHNFNCCISMYIMVDPERSSFGLFEHKVDLIYITTTII